jgi:alkanesulfonate monooxygenase SsuD/methylene tetrahydromethanopterin reductase-like flavin-dependent oxidoreductase (luciferase family)
MPPIRFGISLDSQQTEWSPFLEAARLVDRLGYDTLWTDDHLLAGIGNLDQPIFEAWTTLAAWSTATSRVRLGHFVVANTFRNPGLVAKMVVTLDHASNGRAILGIGGGRIAREHDAFGLDFGASTGQRLDWLDESVGIIRALLAGETVTHDGPHYHTRELKLNPPPLQDRLPIFIGGKGERKTLRAVAKYADIWNAGWNFGVDELRHLDEILVGHAASVGRDPSTIERSTNLCPLIIRDDPREARRVFEAVYLNNQANYQDDLEKFVGANGPYFGSPLEIADRLRPIVDLGFRHFIAHLFSPYDLETIERLILEVKPLLEGT